MFCTANPASNRKRRELKNKLKKQKPKEKKKTKIINDFA